MKKLLLCLLLATASTSFAQQTTPEERIKNRPYPEWFQDAKLGIFIHWGLYSVPSYGGKESYSEWFLRGLQTGDSLRVNFMKEHYGEDFTYKDFAHKFKAELFDPQEWADLFKAAGAKYVVLVSKHHDGYALWPSKYNRNWNSMDTGPKRDIVGELTRAVRAEDLKMGLYYSLPEWNHPLHRWYTDPHDSIGTYVETYMIPQFKELISTYKPSVVFADGEWFNTAEQWHSAELIDWYYDLVGPEAIVNNRWGHGLDVGFLTPEYSAGIVETERPWAEVRGIGRSFGLNRNEELAAYGTSRELIARFVQLVASGGGMILNVGPKADGQIPLIQQERLLQLGNWLQVNGEAIYGSRPYKIRGEEKDFSISRVDPNIDFNWVRNAPAEGIKEDDFQGEWKGFITAPRSGKYLLEVAADDQVQLSLNDEVIISNNYEAPDKEAEVMGASTGNSEKAFVELTAGEAVPLHVKYREIKQNAQIRLFWSGEGIDKEVIPATAFYRDSQMKQPGLDAAYSSKRSFLSYTTQGDSLYAISFEWPGDQLVLQIPPPGEATEVRMLGLDRELQWTYKDGKLLIDTSDIEFEELPSHDAWTFRVE